jgi:error-prone DNA polymerase
MAKFNSYSFCRAHAASYARLAWAGAYLKARHPAEFWVGALNNNASMYPSWVYIEEARRSGIPALLPCVNRSGEEFVLEAGAVRTGLGRVRGLSRAAIASIVKARPYADLADFLARSRVRAGEAESLIRCGALDFAGRPRPAMLLELFTSFRSARRLPGARGLFADAPAPAPLGPGPARDYAPVEKMRDEWELLELWVRRHPLSGLRRSLRRMQVTPSEALPGLAGRRVRVAGMAAAGRTTRSGDGRLMGFVTLCDESGLCEVTLFPEAFARARRLMVEGGLGPFVAEGRVEEHHGAVSLTTERIEVLGRPARAETQRRGDVLNVGNSHNEGNGG